MKHENISGGDRLQYIAYAKSDSGICECVNEDCIAYFSKIKNRTKAFLLIVCDGVGGLSYGEIASRCLVREFYHWFTLLDERIFQAKLWEEEIIRQGKRILCKMNQRIKQVGKRHFQMLGTTISALVIYKNTYVLLHVGDSRVYKINHFVHKISKDHTLYEKKKKDFKYWLKQDREKDKHILTQCVGVTSKLDPYIKVGKIRRKTSFLLCSDGFYQKLKTKEIKKYFSPKFCRKKERICYGLYSCIRLVKEREETDNISAVVAICR